MSGNDDEETALQAVRQAAQDYLVKGDLGPRTLTRTLRYAIERKRLTDRLEAALEENRVLVREVLPPNQEPSGSGGKSPQSPGRPGS